MKLRNPPDYASVEDRRGQNKKKVPTFGENLEQGGSYVNTIQPYGQRKPSPEALIASARASASLALKRMGNQPLPSRRPSQGNNPGSVATMKFPSPSRKPK